VALVDRDARGLGECQATIESGGGRAAAFVIADVGTPGTAEPVAEEAQRRWGGIHVLMRAAGHSCGGTVETTDWGAVYRTNVDNWPLAYLISCAQNPIDLHASIPVQ
jgi:NAD(P)-dependent dehydrogenase (short-subunit alcohol dehydrogenase family)